MITYLFKNYKCKTLFVLILLLMFSLSTPVSAEAEEAAFEGVKDVPCNDEGTMTYSISAEGHLKITGTGGYLRKQFEGEYAFVPFWWEYRDYIKTAEVSVTEITNMMHMFYGLTELESVVFKNTDTSNVTWMDNMFAGCTSLKSLDLSGLDTRNVTTMESMFEGCTSLESLIVKGKNFSTANVTNMYNMFSGCEKLQSLDLSGFQTGNVTGMGQMFCDCKALKTLDLSSFDTSNVTTMSVMFKGCTGLESITFGKNFTVENVKTMQNMFQNCQSLKNIDLSSFKESSVTTMSGMFNGCGSLTSVTFSEQFDTSNVKSMLNMFRDCYELETVKNISGFDTGNVTEMGAMFSSCKALQSLDLSHFNTENVTSMGSMFLDCAALESLNISSFITSNVTSMSKMFSGCQALEILDLSHFKTEKVTSMESMFDNCTSLKSLDVSHFDTSNVKDMKKMFNACHALKELDLSSFDTSLYTSDFSLPMNNLIKITVGTDERNYKLVTRADKWTDDAGNIYDDGVVIVPVPGSTLYIYRGTYNIDYVYDGEIVDAQTSYTMGEPLALSAYVKKEYCDFEGWYTDAQLTKKITEIPADIRCGDITLYAKMIPETYSISYKNVENITNSKLLTTTYAYGEKTSLVEPKRTCYLFGGWYLNENLTEKISEIPQTSVGDLTLYAKWSESHDVDRENGVVIKKATTIEEGEIRYKCKNCTYTEKHKIPRIVTEESQITDETILDNQDDDDIKGSDFTKFQARAVKTTKNSIRLKWNKIDGADGYKIYGNKCGKKNKYELIKDIKDDGKISFTHKKRKKGTYYKYIVRAYKVVDGQEITLAVSKTIHATTTGGKRGNAKSVIIKTDKKMKKASGGYKLTLKKNKKYTIKASEKAGAKKINRHRKICFESSDKNVATVSSKGVVKAKGKGTCYIFAYAQNGVYKKIKVVVK